VQLISYLVSFFNGADSSSKYTASNGGTINEYWIARGLE
jgi:hypothetical protein